MLSIWGMTALNGVFSLSAHDGGNWEHSDFFGSMQASDKAAILMVLVQLKQTGLKDVVLVPFMFVAGEHAKHDIEGDWKEALEEAGFNVNVKMKGLGENVEIQDIFIDHLKFQTLHRKLDILEKKAKYRQTGEKEE